MIRLPKTAEDDIRNRIGELFSELFPEAQEVAFLVNDAQGNEIGNGKLKRKSVKNSTPRIPEPVAAQ